MPVIANPKVCEAGMAKNFEKLSREAWRPCSLDCESYFVSRFKDL
jgi:hypothetical protein